MAKNLEQKILDELKRRVWERDRELRDEKSEQDVLESNKEALAELTHLSLDEVDRMEQEIRAEQMAEQAKRRTKTLRVGGAVLAVLLLIGFIKGREMLRESRLREFVEDFDDLSNGWVASEEFEYKRYFQEDAFVFETNEDGYCYWDWAELDLPAKFTVELSSTWLGGKFDEYGLMLMDAGSSYIAFQLNGDGKSSYAIRHNDDWLRNQVWSTKGGRQGDGQSSNVQTVEVEWPNFRYYVNGTLADEGSLEPLELKRVGLRCCDKQSVRFNHLTIKDNAGRVLLEDDLSKASEDRFDEKSEWTQSVSLADGGLLYKTNIEDKCEWKFIPVPYEDDLSSDFVITLESTWQSGELGHYGLMLMESTADFHAFELRNTGEARSTYFDPDANDFTEVSDYVGTGATSDGSQTHVQQVEVEDGEYRYTVNGKLVGKGQFHSELTYLGLRVCGRQAIRFDKLVLKER